MPSNALTSNRLLKMELQFKMIIVILSTLFGYVLGAGYESVVPPALQKCCGDKLSETCGGISTVTRGQDGHHYVFTNDFVIKTHFNPRGFPQILNSRSYDLNREWFPAVKLVRSNETVSGVLDASLPKAAILYQGVITIMKEGRFYQFEAPKKLSSYDIECEDVLKAAKLHPLYCEMGEGQLVDVTISNSRGLDTDPEIKAFFMEDGVIYEKNYLGTRAMKGRNKTPFQGMSSLFIYHEQVMVHSKSIADFGYAFEETGYACPFVLRKDEVTEHDSPALHAPYMNCLPANIFFGCPQSWCYRADLDDLLLYSSDTFGTKSSVVVYRGNYFFEAEAKIPVIAPPIESHQVLSIGNSNKGRHSFTDACFKVREFMAFIKESDIIMYNNPSGSGSVKKIYDVFPGIWDPILMTDNFGSVDAAFHLPTSSKLYLLIGSSFASYTYEIDGGVDSAVTFQLVEVGSFADHFPGLPANVDGATAFGGNVYIFKDNWVYTVNENQVGISALFPELAYYDPDTGTGFFEADHCGKSSSDWRAVKPQLVQPLPATQSEWAQIPVKYSGDYMVFWVLVILIIMAMIPYMFTCTYCSKLSSMIPFRPFERRSQTYSELEMDDLTLNSNYENSRTGTAHVDGIERVISDPQPAAT